MALEGLLPVTFVTFAMVRNHGNRKGANLLEQLTELYKAEVIHGIRPQINVS